MMTCSCTEEHVRNVLEVLNKLERNGWKADPRKGELYSTQAIWCGKQYCAAGVSCEPERVKAVLEMAPPRTLGNLQQLLGALSWMRTHLPDYAKTVAPLQELLDAGLARLPRRTRRYSDNVQLSELGWSSKHADTLEAVRQMLAGGGPIGTP